MMLPQLSISRPVLAIVVNLIIVLLGVIAFTRLPVRETPKVDPSVVTVNTAYPGANASVIETTITKPIEDALAGIEGIDFMSSTSRAESSQVTVVFNLERDSDSAAADVRDRVNQAKERLPFDARDPIVQKQEADAQPFIWLVFSSDRHDQLAVADAANRLAKDRLQAIPGVAQAQLFASLYAMRVWLKPDRLAGYNLTPQDVEDAIRRQNTEIPAGRIESANREFTVLADTALVTPQQFGDIILRDDGGYLVRLSDVARIELGGSEERSRGRFNGKPGVPMGLVRQSTANPLDISRDLKLMMPLVQEQLPEGMTIGIAYDTTIFISASIKSVYQAIGEAILLVALVIFLFLRNLRATLIPLVTIPVSLIGAMFVMYVMGFSMNTLTLLAMVLAIGLVVDDAIVMLENIHRHIEMGKSPMQAAREGAKEMGFAIVAMTLTLAAVYLPVSFSSGATGKLFIEFALTLAGAVIVSGFVALTLSPMMCSRMLRHETQPSKFYVWGEKILESITQKYRRLLQSALNHRVWVASIALSLGTATAISLFAVPGVQLASELAPKEDPGFILTWGQGPEGSTLDFIDTYAKQIEAAYEDIPEVTHYFMFIGFPTINTTISFPVLKDWAERDRSAQDIAGEMFGRFTQIPGIMAFPQVPSSLGGGIFGQDLEFIVQTSASYERLAEIIEEVKAKLAQNPQILNARSEMAVNKPELRIDVDREKVAAVGADVTAVGRTLETMMGGRQVTRFKQGAEQYDVIVQLDRQDRASPSALTEVYVRGKDETMIQLANLVTVNEGVALPSMDHFNKLRSAQIGASLAPGYSLGDAIDFTAAALKEVAGDEASYDLGGTAREFRKNAAGDLWTFMLALGFIYLVLAAQFESFVDPLVILLSVPLAFAGAMLTLKLTGGSINVYSKIGLITLVGLIAKHGILIVEFANQLIEQGQSVVDATIEAAGLRLRPILMTTAAMVLGAMPLAIASGAGAQARQDIGWVIVGGLFFGTVFTLFVVPAVYVIMASMRGAKTQTA